MAAESLSTLLNQCCRGELGSARCPDGDRADANEGDSPLDNDLDNPGLPTSIDRAPARDENGSVCVGEATRLVCGGPDRAEGPERHRSSSEGCGICGRRRLEPRRECDTDIGYADGENQYETGDGEEQEGR